MWCAASVWKVLISFDLSWGQSETALSSLFRVDCQLQSNAPALLPAARHCIMCERASGEASRQMSSRWGKFSKAARVQPLVFPPASHYRTLPLSLRYRGEGKVAARGHAISRKLFDSSVWSADFIDRCGHLGRAVNKVTKEFNIWVPYCKGRSQFTLRPM